MITTIHKYDAPIEGGKGDSSFTLRMPEGAEVLCTKWQNQMPCIWARVNPRNPLEACNFRWCSEYSDAFDTGRYIGTVQAPTGFSWYGGQFFHLFEAGPR